MALAWKAGWVNALAGSNPASSAMRTPDQRTMERTPAAQVATVAL